MDIRRKHPATSRLITFPQSRYKIETTEKAANVTSHAGLILIRELMQKLGVLGEIKKFFLKKAGYRDDVVIECLLLLICAGGRCLSDFEWMRKEEGFVCLFGGRVPSVDVLEDYLRRLEMSVVARAEDVAVGNVGYSVQIEKLHKLLLQKAYVLAGSPTHLTIDIDAMLIETNKSDARYCYEKYKAYQPFQVYCKELGMVVCHEFRDGNISPMEGHIRIVERVRKIFPKVRFFVRADSAAYENDFMDYLSQCEPVIGYSITVRRYEELKALFSSKDLKWHDLIDRDEIKTGEEYTEICNTHIASNSNEQFKLRFNSRRYYIVRRKKRNHEEQNDDQLKLFDEQETYIYTVVVTNALVEHPVKIILSHRMRFGCIEYFHSQIKGQCGMDMMPSNNFKVNAQWYSLGLLAHNIMRMLQYHVLAQEHQKIEIKTLRFRILRSGAIIIHKARSIIIRFCKNHPMQTIMAKAYEKFAKMQTIMAKA